MVVMASLQATTEARVPARRGGDTREQILDVAADLLQQRGFNGFSYQHIAAQLGIKTAAVHYHFRSKGDLGVALIDRHVEALRAWDARLGHEGLDPLQVLDAYFVLVRGFLVEGHRICLSGALQSELESIPDVMRGPVQGMVAEHLAWLTRLLDRGRHAGVFRFEGPVDDRALATLATMQGALQVGRTCGLEFFDTIARQIRADLVG